jgi:hypothetical protein
LVAGRFTVPNIESRCNQLKLGHPPFQLPTRIRKAGGVPDTSEKQKGKARKVKQQIQWELRSKAKNERGGERK